MVDGLAIHKLNVNYTGSKLYLKFEDYIAVIAIPTVSPDEYPMLTAYYFIR